MSTERSFFMDIIHFSELSNTVLFRKMLNSLWIEYDHGGISVGRSYQARLIEGFMSFFPIQNEHRYLEGDFYRVVQMTIDEARSNVQTTDNHCQLELPFTDMCVLSLEEFTLLSLQELCRWYDEESEAEGFLYHWPKKTAHLLRVMFRLAYSDSIRIERLRHVKYDKQSIIREGGLRFKIADKNERRVADFVRMDINPWTDSFQTYTVG